MTTTVANLTVRCIVRVGFKFHTVSSSLKTIVGVLVCAPYFSLVYVNVCGLRAAHTGHEGVCLIYNTVCATVVLVFYINIDLRRDLCVERRLCLVLMLFYIDMSCYVCVVVQRVGEHEGVLRAVTTASVLPCIECSQTDVFVLYLPILILPMTVFSAALLCVLTPIKLVTLLFFGLAFVTLNDGCVPARRLLSGRTRGGPPSRAKGKKNEKGF